MVDYFSRSNIKDIEQYDHKDKTRLNNPGGLVTPRPIKRQDIKISV